MKKLRLILIIFLGVFILIEFLLRITSFDQLRQFKRPKYIADQALGYRYLPGSKGYKTTAGFSNKYKINSDGFNWDEFKVKKAADTYRIILIGTSDDTGTDTDGPNCYARLLQKKFKENKDNIEIMNFSIDGKHRSFSNISLAYNSAKKYNPDLILINAELPVSSRFELRTTYKGFQITFYDYNESLDRTKEFVDNKLMRPSMITNMYDYSYIFRYICKFYIENRYHPVTTFIKKYFLKDRDFIRGYVRNRVTNLNYEKPPPITKYDLLKSKEIYKKASDSIDLLNSKLVLFTTYESHLNISELLDSNIEYLALDIEYKPEYSFGKKDGHTNQIGHKIIADEFYKKLQLDKFIPKNYFFKKKTHQ